jgi:hypothetical protein
MRGLVIPVLLALSACASAPVVMLDARSNEVFNVSREQSRLSLESRTVAIYLAPCADNLCGTAVIAPGASHFTYPTVAVTNLKRAPMTSLTLDASDSETDLSGDGNSESGGWALQGKRPRPGKRQNFVIRMAKVPATGIVLQLPDVEINGRPFSFQPSSWSVPDSRTLTCFLARDRPG